MAILRGRNIRAERWLRLRSTRHLGRRILLLYAITAAAVAAVFSTALLINWYSTLAVAASDEEGLHIAQELSSVQVSESASVSRLTIYLRTAEPAALTGYREAITARDQAYARLRLRANDGRTVAAVEMLRPTLAQLDPLAERLIGESDSDSLGRGATWQEANATRQAALNEQYLAVIDAEEAAHREAIAGAERTRTTTIALTFLFATTTALLGLWITRKVIQSITVPLEALAAAAAAIGAGRLETRVAPGLSSEFDMLGGVMNTMAASLAESRDELQAALDLTERRNQELRLLSEVGEALDSSLDLGSIIARSLDVVVTAFGLYDGAVVLYGEGEAWHWRSVARGTTLAAREQRTALIRCAVTGPIREEQRLIIIPAMQGDVSLEETLVLVPLEAAVRNHGVLALCGTAQWAPDERQRALLEQVSGQIARAIENVQLYEAEKGRSAEAGMLAQMAQLTAGTLDLDRLARLIARYAVDVLGVDRCIIGFFDPRGEAKGRGQLQRLYQYGFQAHQATLIEGERASLQAIIRRHMLEGQPLVVSDARGDQRPEVRELARRLAVRSFISVPLLARERRLGVIYLDTREPRQHTFGPQDVRILAAIADQAAAAIDGARLFEAERRRGTALRVLNETSQQVAATMQLDRLFDTVIRTIRESLGYARARVGVIEDTDLVFIASQSEDGSRERTRLALDSADPATVVARQGMAQIAQRTQEGREERAELIVPVRAEEQIVGVLAVSRRGTGGGEFDADDERLLIALGDQLGLAVAKSRLHERALALAVVAERNRLARDLHDSVTQSLFSINLTIEATRMLLRRDTDAAEQQLAHLSERTKETLAEMRNLIYSLRPAEMEDQGLVVALKRWGERVRHEHLLPVEIAVEGQSRFQLTDVAERELFRIAQEGLNNVVKHAQATQARVSLRTTPSQVILAIEDDGRGFDHSVASRADAFGLRGMRERVALLGGQLTVVSERQGGTTIRVEIPRAVGKRADGQEEVTAEQTMTPTSEVA